jgi:hypothetical protein
VPLTTALPRGYSGRTPGRQICATEKADALAKDALQHMTLG